MCILLGSPQDLLSSRSGPIGDSCVLTAVDYLEARVLLRSTENGAQLCRTSYVGLVMYVLGIMCLTNAAPRQL